MVAQKCAMRVTSEVTGVFVWADTAWMQVPAPNDPTLNTTRRHWHKSKTICITMHNHEGICSSILEYVWNRDKSMGRVG